MSAHDMEEGMRSLGLPDSPVIHLAINTVAELLQPLDANCPASTRDKCIVRCRVASRAVLEGLPIEICRQEYHSRFGTGFDQAAADAASRLPRTDWLGQAKAALEAIGAAPGPDARKMATRYGWRPDTERPDPKREDGSGLRSSIPKHRPRTAAERSALSAEVALRVKNATPEQKAAVEARRAQSRIASIPSPKAAPRD